MPIEELGHSGIWVNDLEVMEHFYVEVLGLHVTDRDDDVGIVFLSARPDIEHHEFVLQRGRTAARGAMLPHQFSWRIDGLQTLVDFHHKFREIGVPVQQEVTHGNAFGIYFFDPEGNRNEVYVRINKDVRQPFRKTLDLDQDLDAIIAQAELLLADGLPAYQPVTTGPTE